MKPTTQYSSPKTCPKTCPETCPETCPKTCPKPPTVHQNLPQNARPKSPLAAPDEGTAKTPARNHPPPARPMPPGRANCQGTSSHLATTQLPLPKTTHLPPPTHLTASARSRHPRAATRLQRTQTAAAYLARELPSEETQTSVAEENHRHLPSQGTGQPRGCRARTGRKPA